jgi:hypothetical protein
LLGFVAFETVFGLDAPLAFEAALALAVCAFAPDSAFKPSAFEAHTLAPSFQLIPALLQSALVSGWLEVSAANADEAKRRTLPRAKTEATDFIASLPEVYSQTTM